MRTRTCSGRKLLLLHLLRTIMGCAVLSFLSTPVFAVNLNFLKDAPVTRLNESELKQFMAFLSRTLDQASDGTAAEWSAPTTPFKSKFTVQKSAVDGEYRCRQARIESDSRDRKASGEYWFCKTGSGEWGYRIPSSNAKPAPQ